MDRQRALETLERLERRRGETWQGLWLAPLAAVIAQALLLAVLADERIGWLARVAVLAAALATALAAIWSTLRAHAREVQYAEAIAALGEEPDEPFADVRPAALARPRRRRTPPPTPMPPTEDEEPADEPAPEGETEIVTETPASEGKTEVLDATPPPAPAAPIPLPPPSLAAEVEAAEEDWVTRWDRHLVWWASGPSHAKSYMAWTATLALFAVADVAVFLACL